ncbi:PAS domain S-box protein [Dongia deserti]|uniref:PAS domain S-box protein n=1 Tax=Dongia deserti TaxID=2268030 RepID=UPI0013C4DDA5|nr:PAS domain S-box protein [Dongia deserti]
MKKEAFPVDQAVDATGALAELARRTAMLDAISYAAAQIIGAEDWRIGIQELLNRLGRATDVSRVTLFEIHKGPDGRPVESCRYDWAEPGYARLSGDPRHHNIPLVESAGGQLSAWTAARQRGEIVQATLKDVTGETRQSFLEHGTQSFISVPIMLRTGVWGFLGLDDCRIERVWHPLEVDVLKTAAALIAGAIERAATDEALRNSRERYELAARGTNDGLWDWDLVENRTYLSPRLYEILGITEGSLEGPQSVFATCCLSEDAADWRKHIEKCIAEGRSKFEFEARLANTAQDAMQQRWVVIRGLIMYEGGRATRLVGSLRDITDRKRVELALRASETRARAILDTAFDPIINIDADGRIVEFNAAASRTFGFSRDEAVGKTVSALIIPPLHRATHEAGLRRYLETGEAGLLNRMVEVEALRHDGSHIPVDLSVTEVPVAEGRLFTAVLRDISERKRFEAELANAERQRAQLTRHFSPNMVEEIMQAGGRIGTARTQPMAVLFSDLYDYTEMSATMSGEQVIALLREFHVIVEDAVFNHGGTLDKYIGDGLMATFGTPTPGQMDATNAIAATRQMLRELARWNQRREARGEPRIRIGVGLHFGMATLGDVGTDQRFELTVVGDTINIASRIEQMSRLVRTAVVASDDIIQQAIAECGQEAAEGFRDLGEHRVRGRQSLIRLWGLSAESQRP